MKIFKIAAVFVLGFGFAATTVVAMDNEANKERGVEVARREKTAGFQGCVNKATCGEYRLYLDRYSPEGLCSKCEFVQYPERFIACVFCRKPYQKINNYLSFSCLGCLANIQKTLVEQLKISSEWRDQHTLEMGAFSYLRKSYVTVGKKSIASFSDVGTRLEAFRLINCATSLVYLGAKELRNGNLQHIWSLGIAIDPSDKRAVLDVNDAEAYVAYICEKYHVFGPETGSPFLGEIPSDSVTYEEIIGR